MDERLVALETELAGLRSDVARLRRSRGTGRWRVLLATAIVVALALTPLGVLGANFIDLNNNSPHNGNINAIADAGISRGCGDTAHYCPNNLVTREEMASFLARTAGLGGNPPVTNAATAINSAYLNGFSASALARLGASGTGTTTYSVTGSYLIYATVTLDAPTSGFVLVSGAAHIYAASSGIAPVFVRLADPANNLVSLDLIAAVGTLSGSSLDTSLSPVVRFPVYGAGSRTYWLQIARDNTVSSGTTNTNDVTITALFVPFGAGGAQAASIGNDPGLRPLSDTPPVWTPPTP